MHYNQESLGFIVVKEDMEYICLGHLTFEDIADERNITYHGQSEIQWHIMARTDSSEGKAQQIGFWGPGALVYCQNWTYIGVCMCLTYVHVNSQFWIWLKNYNNN